MKLEKNCETCYHNQRDCSYLLSANCLQYGLCDWEPYTNYDHIKNMWLNEMAEFLCSFGDCGCCPARDCCDRRQNGFREWLKMKVKVDEQSK